MKSFNNFVFSLRVLQPLMATARGYVGFAHFLLYFVYIFCIYILIYWCWKVLKQIIERYIIA